MYVNLGRDPAAIVSCSWFLVREASESGDVDSSARINACHVS
jgi:hypothetical protein